MLQRRRSTATLAEDNIATYEHHSVDVVHVSVFPTSVMDIVPWHRDFRAVEDGGFVHVVPDEEEFG